MKLYLKTIHSYFNRFGVSGFVARYLLYKGELAKFVRRGRTLKEKTFRRDLVRSFTRIHRNIPCAHSPFQFIEMAAYLLDLNIKGPMVACGCFKGGSTAKLSLLAKQTQRRLFVCDSFQGMPSLPNGMTEITYAGSCDVPDSTVYPGKFEVTLDEVKRNISEYGCIEVCEFVPGYFETTLPFLRIGPAFVYTDVAIISSARDCLKYLWPRLKYGGYWFTHEASYMEYILGTFDFAWWLEALGQPPPLIIGAGSGLSILSPSLAYLRKLKS
jgi:hypothetical protein